MIDYNLTNTSNENGFSVINNNGVETTNEAKELWDSLNLGGLLGTVAHEIENRKPNKNVY
jgi:hypothetical protein